MVCLRGSIGGSFFGFVNDITKLFSITELILFADATNIFMSCPDLDKLVECVNSELEKKITRWLIINKLTLNLKKTNYVVFA